jgi:hypothetical protein
LIVSVAKAGFAPPRLSAAGCVLMCTFLVVSREVVSTTGVSRNHLPRSKAPGCFISVSSAGQRVALDAGSAATTTTESIVACYPYPLLAVWLVLSAARDIRWSLRVRCQVTPTPAQQLAQSSTEICSTTR